MDSIVLLVYEKKIDKLCQVVYNGACVEDIIVLGLKLRSPQVVDYFEKWEHDKYDVIIKIVNDDIEYKDMIGYMRARPHDIIKLAIQAAKVGDENFIKTIYSDWAYCRTRLTSHIDIVMITAIEYGKYDIVEYILDTHDFSDTYHFVMYAIKYRRIAILKLFIARNIAILKYDSDIGQNYHLIRLIDISGNQYLMHYLIQHGIDMMWLLHSITIEKWIVVLSEYWYMTFGEYGVTLPITDQKILEQIIKHNLNVGPRIAWLYHDMFGICPELFESLKMERINTLHIKGDTSFRFR